MAFFRSKKSFVRAHSELSTEEILFEADLMKQESADVLPRLEFPLTRAIFMLFLSLWAFLGLGLLSRVWWLQAGGAHSLAFLGASSKEQIHLTSAPRGQITDRFGKILATNEPVFYLYLAQDAASDVSRITSQLAILAPLLERDVEDLKHTARNAASSAMPSAVVIPDGERTGNVRAPHEAFFFAEISQEAARRIVSRHDKLPDFSIRTLWQRTYPGGEVTSHVTGYIGKIAKEEFQTRKDYAIEDVVGRNGVEAAFENILRGTPEKILETRDAKRTLRSTEKLHNAVAGEKLALTIDYDLQKTIGDALERKIRELGIARTFGAAAVAMDPRSGDVLAMVSIPDYDPNVFVNKASGNDEKVTALLADTKNPLFNRALSGVYPPGSTVKPLVATAALAENIIASTEKIFAPSEIVVPSVYDPGIVWTFRDWRYHGWVNMREAIAYSSDVYFYTVGGGYGARTGLGPELLARWFEKFGLGKRFGIGLPGEAKGLVPTPEWKENTKGEQWYIGNTYHEAIGQGDLLVTPLQLATAISAVVNGGTLFQPRFLMSSPSRIIQERIADDALLSIVRSGMQDAVRYGTAKLLNDLPVSSGAKTGTAQFGVGGKQTHAWFVAFAPYREPEIVVVVLIEGGGEGSYAAAPVAREILQWYFARNAAAALRGIDRPAE